MNDLLEDLHWRGLIHNSTDLASLSKRMNLGPIRFYCGFDPTADSLHLGSLQMLILMTRFMLHGHTAITLIGGGTGLIGDPSGKKEERSLRTEKDVESLASAMQSQIGRLLSSNGDSIFVNNKDWLLDISAMELLRDYGKHFNINEMLKRDSVSSRLNSGGMSFTEFAYMLLQSVDFLTLARDYDCDLQIGGSDQWGNMSSGIHLINAKKIKKECHVLTAPLILNGNGTKFGKSESGNIWLDGNKTSPMQLFQHLINVDDAQAKILLRQLTLLPKADIEAIEVSNTDPSKRLIQKRVAFEVVKFVHGIDVASRVGVESEQVFSSDSADLLADFVVSESDTKTWEDLFMESKMVASKSEARRLAGEGGLSVWDTKIVDMRERVDFASQARNGVILLIRGKRHRCVVGLDK